VQRTHTEEFCGYLINLHNEHVVLSRLCGIQLSWMTAHHPVTNGLMRCFHQTQTTAILCHTDKQWTEALPLVLLGICTAFREDLQESAAELIHGKAIRIPSELRTSTADPVDPVHLTTEFHQHVPPQTSCGNMPHFPGYIHA
jgi:hypothetical protein